MVLLSGGSVRDVHDLELETVGVVEEDGVVAGDVAVLLRLPLPLGADARQPGGALPHAGDVAVLLRLALQLGADAAQPAGALVDVGARVGLEAEVVQADGVAVVAAELACLRLAQADARAGAAQVEDRLAALALDLADAV